ncbi:FAD-dependent oxidoreductase [Trinickia fusca]|uniref:FAD-dependent monooxygenase n=1 Tax=Trinickia fusca TaxID=2419777 RepID=A0A494XMX6_9BURK|nr:NAD(P)/FAD-dependent oxidoreductase [Trinickia fusca]RKP51081.1 FAD-dependent monooxygenase [Trinickia fusca]
MAPQDQEFVIAGAGIAGMTLALLLHRMGRPVLLLERRTQDAFLSEESRSINFTLTARGLTALRRLGLQDRALNSAVRLRRRVVHDRFGAIATQRYGSQDTHAIYSIRRKALLEMLYEAIRGIPGISIIHDAPVETIDCHSGMLTYSCGEQRQTIRAGTIVAADGAFSRVRSSFVQQTSAHCHLTDFPSRYLELHGGRDFVAKLGLPLDALHVWPGHQALLVGIPNPDATIALMFVSEDLQGYNRERFAQIFASHFPRVPITADMASQLKAAPLGRLASGELSRWHHESRVVFVGDACHPVLPFYGQGMNAALEDCFVLSDLIGSETSRAQAFTLYEARRKPQTDALAVLSRSHFSNLQRGALSARWQASTFMDLWLARLTRGSWFYEYEKVAHTNLPYDSIVARLARQRSIKRRSGLLLVELGLAFAISLLRQLRLQLWTLRRSSSRATTSVPSPR